MDKSPSLDNSSSINGSTPISTPFRRSVQRRRNNVAEDGGVDTIECTGKSCKSCTAGVIADCVAISCCPCVVVDIMAFTFLKVPYLMGRKWLSKGRKKIKSKEKRKKMLKEKTNNDGDRQNRGGRVALGGRNGNSRIVSVENEEVEIENKDMEFVNEEVNDHFSAEEEEENVWLELYRIGHLGFGRVSFSSFGSSQRKSITN